MSGYAPPDTWRLSEVRRIGWREQDFIPRMMIDEAGLIHVVYATQPGVHVFDREGRLMWTIANGLGDSLEVRAVAGMGKDSNGSLWVMDRERGFVVFDPAARFRRVVPRSSNSNAQNWRGGFDDRGRLYDPAFGPGGLISPVLLHLDDAGLVVDTIPLPYLRPRYFPAGPPVMGKAGPPTPGGRPQPVVGVVALHDVPYSPEIVWRFDPAGFIWFARTDEYRIYRRSLDGDTVAILGRTFTPVRVTPAEKETLAQRIQPFMIRGEVADTSLIPFIKPILHAIYVAEGDRLWVRLTPENEIPVVFDVFEDEEYVARLEVDFWLPLEPPPVFRADTVYMIREQGVAEETYVLQAVIERRGVGEELGRARGGWTESVPRR